MMIRTVETKNGKYLYFADDEDEAVKKLGD